MGGPARSQDRRDQARHAADAEGAALRHGVEFEERRVFRRVRHQQGRDDRQQDHGDQGIRFAGCGRPAAADRHLVRRHDLVHRLSPAASSAGSIRRPARSPSGRRRAVRSRSPTASSSPRARSGTTSRLPSRTPSCASIPRPRSSRPGPFPAAATSCATWTSRPTAIPVTANSLMNQVGLVEIK